MSTLSSIGTSSSALSQSSSSTGTLSVGGLVTGLNTSQIIQGLLAVQQAQINSVKARQGAVTQQETAYKGLQAQLLSFQGSVTQLAQFFNGPFDGRTAASSDTSLVTAAASSSAAAGVYTIKVNALATASQVASQGFDGANAQITQGTLTVGGGSKSATITIDNSNNTLQGLAAAINTAGAGVGATVVNDGTAHPYRLLLTASQTGTANAITVNSSLAAPAPGGSAVAPAFDQVVQQATNASVTLGSGAGALTVTSPDNTVNDVIGGVTLNLAGADATKSVQVNVANDTDTARKAVQDFVTAYNQVISAIDGDVSYDPQTQKAGVLLGDPSIVGIEDRLRNLVTQPVAGVNPRLNSLSALGVTSDQGGQLRINDAQLTKVLTGQVSGVTLADVRNFFALSGQSTNTGVTYVNATSATKSSTTPYGVVITRAALPAAVAGDAAPTLDLSNGGTTFTLTVNGKSSGPITVPPDNYPTTQILLQALQAQINGNSELAGLGVTAGLVNNKVTFTTTAYGRAAGVGIGASPLLGFNAASGAKGQDAAGSFLVNGTAEAATGRGQLLIGDTGNANTDGLAVRVSLLASQTSPDGNTPVANVTVSRGLAAQLNDALNGLIDPHTGQLQSIDQNYQAQIAAYQKTIDQLNTVYSQRQDQLTKQFTQLETTISNLKTAGSFLSAQTAALQSLSSSSSSH